MVSLSIRVLIYSVSSPAKFLFKVISNVLTFKGILTVII